MSGKELRHRVDAISELMEEVKAFIEESQGGLDSKTSELIERINDDSGDLFYLIPLEK